jgi:glycosyltransferase involved in cell wall biosynthesis
MEKFNVLVTFDSMKDTNCGYFSFGKGLGDALIKENKNQFNLKFYLFKKTKYLFNGLVDIIYLGKLDRLFFSKRNNFEVLHLTDQTCRLRPSKVNAKKIMTIHDMNKVHIKRSKEYRIQVYLKKLQKFISQCDRIVCISEFVAKDVLHYFPEAKNKTSVIYNGADKLILSANHEPKVKPYSQFLFTIGLLSPQKGFHLLPALLQDNNFELVISGIETPHKQKIIAEATKYNCLNRVHITGPISDSDKAWYYKNCAAFLFPSIAEGFGLPVIEAMHFGKPVFLSKYTSLPEVGGDAAYYFDNFEPSHMQQVFANGMQDYFTNNREEKIIAQSDKFSWNIAAKQYLSLYQEVLKDE